MSYRKNLALQLGPIQASVNLLTVLPSAKSKTRRLCANHKLPLNQQYLCPGQEKEPPHVVEWGTWVLGAETSKGYSIVPEETKPSIEKVDSLTLTPVPAKEIEANTIEGSAIYYAQPSTAGAHQTWTILHRVVRNGKTALIAKGALRKGSEKIWRVTVFRDYLVLRELTFPSQITDTPEKVEFKVDAATTKLVGEFVENLMTSWEDMDTTNTMEAHLNEWLESGEIIDRPEGAATEVTTGQAGDDLKASIEKAIQQSK